MSVTRIAGMTSTLAVLTLAGFAGQIHGAEITLSSRDGNVSILGELIESTDEYYLLDTQIGPMRIDASTVVCAGPGCPQPETVTILAGAKIGERVTISISAPGKEVRVAGELLSFTDQTYGIKTMLGPFYVPAEGAICEGLGCPVLTEVDIADLKDPVIATPVIGIVRQEQAPDPIIASFNVAQVGIAASEAIGNSGIGLTRIDTPGFNTSSGLARPAQLLDAAPISSATPSEQLAVSVLDAGTPEVGNADSLTGNSERPQTTVALSAELVTATDVRVASAPQKTAPVTPASLEADLIVSGSGHLIDVLTPRLLEAFANFGDGTLELAPPLGSADRTGSIARGSETSTLALMSVDLTDEDSVREAKRADIAFALSSQKITERQLNRSKTVAVDAMVAIVSPENPVNSISQADLMGVLSGRITNWSELGGRSDRIILYSLPPEDATHVQARRLLGHDSVSDTAKMLQDSDAIVEAVNSEERGISIVNIQDVATAKPLSIVQKCGIVTPANLLSVKASEYPLSENILAIRTARRNIAPISEQMLEFFETSANDKAVANDRLIDLSITAQPLTERRNVLADSIEKLRNANERTKAAELVDLMRDADRLSPTFRFQRTSLRLDGRAPSDVKRVLEYLRNNDVTDLYIVGFSDTVGGFATNETQSLRRAQAVAGAMQVADQRKALRGIDLHTLGMSEINPVACNQVTEGRGMNRRVEIWVSKSR